jgi:KUP system potassium uptake protein
VTAKTSRFPLALVVAAMGVVFGDIGTSPLYTLKTCFALAGVKPDLPDVLGICSLLFWALTIVVCVKYVGFVMRVTHDGEGGDLALLALASPQPKFGQLIPTGPLTIVVIISASMLLGDGVITPAISVLSAVEGVGVVSSAFHPYIVPIALVVVVGLFALQHRGTERVGRLFGPVMLVWFITIAVLGANALVRHPAVLRALDPIHALAFVTRHGFAGFTILGGVVLAITGVEALYADLSHFGYRPIAIGWYALVFPSLILNYFGQGAKLLADPAGLVNPFYSLAPNWALIPMTVLSTVATVIASQALISGTFTVTEQAIALSLAPRVLVRHTSHAHRGQVFVPSINRLLMIGCVVLIVAFRSSDRLAAAYGLAVSFTMLCTSIAYYTVITKVLHWPRLPATLLFAMFVIVDGSFVLASLPKFLQGGYIPVAISAVLVVMSLTWLEGRRILARALALQQTPVEEVLAKLPPTESTSGTMVFLTPDPRGVPFLARHRWIRDRAHEECIVLLNIERARSPYVTRKERVTVERLSPRFVRVVARFGFMEPPRIDPIFRSCALGGLDLDHDDTSFFYADPKIEPAHHGGMPGWRRELYATLQRNSRPLPDDLKIRAERRVELGVTVAM